MMELFAAFGIALLVVFVILSLWGICCAIFDDPDTVTMGFFALLLLIVSIGTAVISVNHLKTTQNVIEVEEHD